MRKQDEALGAMVEIGQGVRPVITMFGHGGHRIALQWQGAGFDIIDP